MGRPRVPVQIHGTEIVDGVGRIEEDVEEEERRDMSGAKNPNAKLTEEDVERIRNLYQGGIHPFALARTFGVTPQHIRGIVRGKYRGNG